MSTLILSFCDLLKFVIWASHKAKMTFQVSRLFEKSFSRHRLSVISDRPKAQNEFSRLGDSLNITFLEVKKFHLYAPRWHKNTLKGLWSTRIIAFPTSHKSYFGFARRQNINKQGQANTWNNFLHLS
jgi:hypothetical protein